MFIYNNSWSHKLKKDWVPEQQCVGFNQQGFNQQPVDHECNILTKPLSHTSLTSEKYFENNDEVQIGDSKFDNHKLQVNLHKSDLTRFSCFCQSEILENLAIFPYLNRSPLFLVSHSIPHMQLALTVFLCGLHFQIESLCVCIMSQASNWLWWILCNLVQWQQVFRQSTSSFHFNFKFYNFWIIFLPSKVLFFPIVMLVHGQSPTQKFLMLPIINVKTIFELVQSLKHNACKHHFSFLTGNKKRFKLKQ